MDSYDTIDAPMKWLELAALFAAAFYVILCSVLYVLQDRLLYFPTPAANAPGATAIHVRSGELSLKVWQLHANARHAVIYFGGNAEDVAAKAAEFAAMFPDRAVYLVHYRGYGGNAGAPSERLLISDAQAMFDDIRARHEKVAVMGRSLGSGIATALAATRPVDRVILITPYDSIANVAADHYSWAPVHWLVRDAYDSAGKIRNVRAPVLVLIAARDAVVLRPRSDALVAAIPAHLASVRVFPHASHNDINLQPGYRESMREFLAPL